MAAEGIVRAMRNIELGGRGCPTGIDQEVEFYRRENIATVYWSMKTRCKVSGGSGAIVGGNILGKKQYAQYILLKHIL